MIQPVGLEVAVLPVLIRADNGERVWYYVMELRLRNGASASFAFDFIGAETSFKLLCT